MSSKGIGNGMIIAVCGERCETTGFGRVSVAIHTALLALGVDSHLVGIGPTVHPAFTGSTSSYDWRTHLAEISPDAMVFVGDVWCYPLLKNELDHIAPRAASIVYFVTEYEVEPEMAEALDGASHIIVPSQWAYDSLVSVRANLFSKLSVVPHGVDLALFSPIIDRSESAQNRPGSTQAKALLAEVLQPYGVNLTDFLVFNGNQNVRRKRLDLTLEAFALFQACRTDAKLILLDSLCSDGVDLRALLEAKGLQQHVISLKDLFASKTADAFSDNQQNSATGITNALLNTVYNACDVGINTAMAEGWGLISWEHAAAGAAQIVPDMPLHRDIWSNGVLFAETTPSPVRGPYPRTCYLTDTKLLAQQLCTLYDDADYRLSIAQAGRDHVTADRYNWHSVAAGFLDAAVRCTRNNSDFNRHNRSYAYVPAT